MRPSSRRGCRTEVNGTAAAAAKSISSKPTMASCSGTLMPMPMHCCRSPRASRSLAQKAAVGRETRDSPAIRSPAFAAFGDAGCRGRHDGNRGSGAVEGRLRHMQAVTHLADRLGPADEGDVLVAEVEEVLDGEPTTEDVVNGDRAMALGVADTIDDQDQCAVALDLVEDGCDGSTGVIRIPIARCCCSR